MAEHAQDPGAMRLTPPGRRRPRAWTALLFLLPALIVYGLFNFYSILMTLFYSLQQWGGISPNMTFIGFDNYAKLLTTPAVWRSLLNNLQLVVISLIVQTTGFVSNAEVESPEFFAKMKTGKYPVVEEGAGNIDDMLGGGNVFSISESCTHKKEAVALLSYLLAQETGQDFLTNAASVPSQLGMKASSPQMQEVMDIIAEAKYVQNYYDQGLPAAMGDLHKETTQAIFGLDSTSAEAAAIMEAKAVEILGPAK